MNYADLLGPDGQADNMGGTTQLAYFAPVSTFLSIKKPTTSPTTPDDLVKITTTHTFKTGFCWQKLYCTMNKGTFDAKHQGELDGKSLKHSGKVFLPGNLASAHGFAAMCKNDNFLVEMEVPDSATGGYIQVGTEMFPCKINPNFSVATNEGGVRGHEFDLETVSPRTYIYTGAITLVPAP